MISEQILAMIRNNAEELCHVMPRVTTPVRKLDPSAWPQCPICGDSLATHDCDPDATFATMLGALNMGGSNG
jgi:hypothetical protein